MAAWATRRTEPNPTIRVDRAGRASSRHQHPRRRGLVRQPADLADHTRGHRRGQHLEFARYPSTGGITYKRAIELRPRTIRFLRRNLASIVVHGIDYNGNGVYDQTLGASDLNSGLDGEATAPALCGELVADPAGRQSTRRHSAAGQIYSSALALPSTAASVICHIRRTT